MRNTAMLDTSFLRFWKSVRFGRFTPLYRRPASHGGKGYGRPRLRRPQAKKQGISHPKTHTKFGDRKRATVKKQPPKRGSNTSCLLSDKPGNRWYYGIFWKVLYRHSYQNRFSPKRRESIFIWNTIGRSFMVLRKQNCANTNRHKIKLQERKLVFVWLSRTIKGSTSF